MAHEPRALVLDLQYPVQLMRADALLGRAKKVEGLQPHVQVNVARLENRANANRKLLTAVAALFQTVANDAFRVLLARFAAHAFKRIDPLFAAAVRAYRTIRPHDAFDHLESGFLIVEVRLVENRHDIPRF